MTTYQNMNQFSQQPIKGAVSAVPNPTVIPCQIDPNSEDTFYPGTGVRLVAGTGKTVLVVKAAATEEKFGFVVWNPKKSSFTAGDAVEVAMPGSVMYMEAAAAFNRGQSLEQVVTGDKVQAVSAAANDRIGLALDTAAAAGDLVRVYLRGVFQYSSSSCSSSSSCRSSSSSSSASA